MLPTETETYRVVPSVFAKRSHAHTAERFHDLTTAVTAMRTGMVINSADQVVAFHESHLRFVEAGVGQYRV